MTEASVSAIVPVRDGERYIGDALDSILGQSAPPDQVIVVDDGSQDGTATVVERFGKAVELLRRDPKGIGAALNAGLEAAHGDLLSFLDADDLWAERKLELQVALLGREPGVDMAFGLAEQFISPDLTAEQRAGLRPPPGPMPAKAKGTMLARRSAFDRVGPFGTQWQVADFIDWHERARSAGLVARVVPQVLLRRRIHESNIGRSRRDARGEYARVVAESLRRRRDASDQT